MQKLIFIIFLLFTIQFSKAQEKQAKDFYQYLEKIVPTTKSDSITLTVIEYNCLGSQTKWNAKLTNIDNLVKVDVCSQKPVDIAKPLSDLKTSLDTTFTVEKNILKKNIREEMTKIKSKRIYIEASFKISLNYRNSNTEFTFIRGEGLYYLLRFNQTFESYFHIK